MNTTDSNLSDLVSDMAFQPRVGLDDDHVEGMVRALGNDLTTFEDKPIQVWRIGGKLFIVDGHHRFAAFTRKRECFAAVPVVIHETQRAEGMSDDEHVRQSWSDALQHAITANNHHGSPLKRSRADNRRAVELVLNDPIRRQLSDAAIAEMVGVSAPTVASIRKSNPEYQVEHRTTKDGRVVSRDRQASGADKRKKTEPQDTAAVEPERPVAGVESGPVSAAEPGFAPISSSVTSVMVRGLDDMPEPAVEPPDDPEYENFETLPELETLFPQYDPRTWKILEKSLRTYGMRHGIILCTIEGLPGRYILDGHIRHRIAKELGIETKVNKTKVFHFESVNDAIVWAIECQSGQLNLTVAQFAELEAKYPFCRDENSTSEPEPADNGKRNRFDWTTDEGIRESMRYTKSQGYEAFGRWCQNYRLPDKRKKFPQFPDDETLRSWWDSISA